ncbi:MAG: hypothetical protein RI932_665 [Pseudomonadota bacterium]|jgi:nucleotidyltransferase substrate binding protein (TIGR01987 family)
MGVSLAEFEKAVQALESVLMLPEDDVVRDASIQRFEFCVELAWKTSRKLMGTNTTAPKQVIREMAQNGLISDIQKWFDAIEKRNLSSHTYDEVLAREVYQFLKVFAPEFRILLNELGKK